jgi:hypothetical protein
MLMLKATGTWEKDGSLRRRLWRRFLDSSICWKIADSLIGNGLSAL